MRKVTLYTTAGCPRCEEARRFLRDRGIEFSEVDVAGYPLALHRTMVFAGTPALPAIDVDGDVLVGFDPEKLTEMLLAG